MIKKYKDFINEGVDMTFKDEIEYENDIIEYVATYNSSNKDMGFFSDIYVESFESEKGNEYDEDETEEIEDSIIKDIKNKYPNINF